LSHLGLELFALDLADRLILVFGDTDLAPAINSANQVGPKREVCFAFPRNRMRNRLEAIASGSCLAISAAAYQTHQFVDPAVTSGVSFLNEAAFVVGRPELSVREGDFRHRLDLGSTEGGVSRTIPSL
jgi:hypothetical protein